MSNPQGVVQTNPMNKPSAKMSHQFNTFDDTLSYRNANTIRFGEYTPTFLMEGVPDDTIHLNSVDAIDSLSLKAPFKGTIRKIKESFKVPLMAILPHNWDLIYTQPSVGDDVPKDANCVLQMFPQNFSTWWIGLLKNVADAGAAFTSETSASLVADWFSAFFRLLVLGEYVYSNGSLLSTCGYHASSQFRYKKLLPSATSDEAMNGASYDKWMDGIISLVFSRVKEFHWYETIGSTRQGYTSRGISSTGEPTSDWTARKSSFRFFLEKMRDNPTIQIDSFEVRSDSSLTELIGIIAGLTAETGYGMLDYEGGSFEFILPAVNDVEQYSDMSQCNLNLSRLLAYQMVCAHFYTNSSIDVVYSAELVRQYMHNLNANTSPSTPSNATAWMFSRNGMLHLYDDLSGNVLGRQLYMNRTNTELNIHSYSALSNPTGPVNARLASYAAVFGYRKSLRFGDYFVGCRPRPLAPINTDVAVNDGAVSVIDVTRGIQAQRFANAVMRTRQKIDEYVKAMFKNAPAPDYHNPFFLAREAEIIYGDEVQNTGANQASNANSRTANFAANTGRYTFTFNNDDAHPCIYMQIISFDVKRAYTRTVDRHFLHLDRYDMFNPDFQFIGDQPIYGIELGYLSSNSDREHFFANVFGYQSRDMEYKQRFDVASGGFVENLPGWLLTDRSRDVLQPAQLTPDFIRSFNTELDQFYLSLSGYALGNYFHFICITKNNVTAKRPMAVDPQILE